MYNFAPRSFYRLVRHVYNKGTEINGTKELINFSFKIKNPIDRLVSVERKINFPFAVAEWLAMVTCDGRLSFFKTFINDYDKYSTDKKFIDGAYGLRISDWGKSNQIEAAISELAAFNNSRRAVISIFNGSIDLVSKDLWIPCTETFQFLIRDNKLHMIVNMRSNDVYLGVPYDIFSFTMIQEYIAMRLGVPLGTYFHNAGSFHIYERQYQKAFTEQKYIYGRTMDPMKFELPEVFHLKLIYDNIEEADLVTATRGLSPYLADFAWAARAFVRRSFYEEAIDAYEKIRNSAIKRVMSPWIKKEK